MNRLFAFLLALVMLLSLASCSTEEPENLQKTAGASLDGLSAQKLYETAVKNTKNLPASRFNTVIECEGAEQEVKSYRAKEGYDGFSYARIGEDGGVWFLDKKAYIKDESGSFSAEISSRAFREYLDAYYAPVGLLESDCMKNPKKDGLNVTYELNEKGLALLSKAIKGFSSESATVRAKITQEGLVGEETFLLKGSLSGKDVTVNMNTLLLETRGESIFDLVGMTRPEEDEFATVSDIRIPLLMKGAAEKLTLRQNLSLTFFQSFSAKVGENTFVDYREHNLTQKNPGEFYHSLRVTGHTPGNRVDTFTQTLLSPEGAVENTYDMTTFNKIGENLKASPVTPWPALFNSPLPAVSSMEDIKMETGTENDTITFSITEAASREYAMNQSAFFAAVGVDPSTFTLTSSEGSVTVSKGTGELVAFFVTFEGNTDRGAVTAQLSLTVEKGEVTSLPQLQIPSAEARIFGEH